MIITRAPLRISIGGGGTDLPSFYRNNNGTVFSSLAINKYIYVSVNERFKNKLLVRYSENEEVSKSSEIKHPIVRETLIDMGCKARNLEITSTSDIPSGTGLGSSGTFGVSLQKALREYLGLDNNNKIVANKATDVEMNILKRPIGLQDQYIASYGGLSEFTVESNDEVSVDKKELSSDLKNIIENNLLLFFADVQRDASNVLTSDSKKMKSKKYNFGSIVDMGQQMLRSLLVGDLREYGTIMHDYWLLKRERQKGFTEKKINEIYDHIYEKKLAYGGKLVGAGGSGFLLFCSNDPEKLRKEMTSIGLKELSFKADELGVQTLEK